LVSWGAQKNFERFMAELTDDDTEETTPLPDVALYKQMIAKAILFRKTQSLIRPMFPAFQANVTAYLISVLASGLGDRLDFDKIWIRQDLSTELKRQLQTWAVEVNKVLHDSAAGRMISEWSKRTECWEAVRSAVYSPPSEEIPETR
jgi:hypothetical protein